MYEHHDANRLDANEENSDASISGFAIASLVMGILTLSSCIAYGVPVLIFGPLAIWFASKAKVQVLSGHAAPSSLSLASAGKVTGIIGLCLFVVAALVFLVLFVILGFTMANFP